VRPLGPDPKFVAVRRCLGYQRETRRSAAAALPLLAGHAQRRMVKSSFASISKLTQWPIQNSCGSAWVRGMTTFDARPSRD
jgi:hypothetical protein